MKKFFFGILSAYFIFPLIENITNYTALVFQYLNELLTKKILIIKQQIQELNKEKDDNHTIGFIQSTEGDEQ